MCWIGGLGVPVMIDVGTLPHGYDQSVLDLVFHANAERVLGL